MEDAPFLHDYWYFSGHHKNRFIRGIYHIQGIRPYTWKYPHNIWPSMLYWILSFFNSASRGFLKDVSSDPASLATVLKSSKVTRSRWWSSQAGSGMLSGWFDAAVVFLLVRVSLLFFLLMLFSHLICLYRRLQQLHVCWGFSKPTCVYTYKRTPCSMIFHQFFSHDCRDVGKIYVEYLSCSHGLFILPI